MVLDASGGMQPPADEPVPSVSVVIPAHDAEETLAEQLEALANQIGAPPFEVVVVLNRCSDDSRGVAASFASDLDLRIVVADDRPNVAYARNTGWRASRGDHVLFCDADDRVAPGWVAGMLAPLVADRADLVGGQVVVDRTRLKGRRAWFYDAHYRSFDGACLHQQDPAWPLGATLGVRRSVLERVDGYDERFDRSGEEVWLTRQAVRAGFRVGEAPDAELLYRPRATLRSFLAQYAGYARSSAQLAMLEGHRLRRPPRGRVHLLFRVARKAVKAFVRRGVRDPRRLLLRVVWDLNFLRAHRGGGRAAGPRQASSELESPAEDTQGTLARS